MNFTKETLKRMLRTFFQTAVSYAVIHVATVDFAESKQLLRASLTGIGVSAAAAGVSAVMNLEKKQVDKGGAE